MHRALQIVKNIVSARYSTKDASRNCILRFKTNCCDEKSAVYTLKVNHSIFKTFIDRKLEHVFK